MYSNEWCKAFPGLGTNSECQFENRATLCHSSSRVQTRAFTKIQPLNRPGQQIETAKRQNCNA